MWPYDSARSFSWVSHHLIAPLAAHRVAEILEVLALQVDVARLHLRLLDLLAFGSGLVYIAKHHFALNFCLILFLFHGCSFTNRA